MMSQPMKPETVQMKEVSVWRAVGVAGLAAWLVVACAGAPGRAAAGQALPPGSGEVALVSPSSGEAADVNDPRKLPVIADLDLSNATLAQSFDRIRDASGVNLVVRWPALKAAGVDPDKPVRMRLWDTRVGGALDIVLFKTLGADPKVVWQLRGNVIVVSTPEDLSDSYTRTFDVRDLVRAIHDASREQDNPLTWAESEWELIRVVTDAVDPGSWFDAGGSLGAIKMTRRRLVVTQSLENTRKVGTLLDSLRDELNAPPPARAERPQAPARNDGPRGVAAVLLKDVTLIENLDLPNSTFEQAMGRISAVANVPVEVNWRALESAGFTRDTPVSVHLRQVPLGRALVEVLSAGGHGTRFRATEVDGVVTVSTWEDVKPEPARFYDVRDLLDAVKGSAASGPKGAGGREQKTGDAEAEIIRLITENVEPESWREKGGSHGTIRCLWGRLIVVQTADAHQVLERFLATLRHEFMKDDPPAAPPKSPSAPSTPAPRPAGG